MEINLLKEELKDLQIRYKNVLLKAKDNIFRTDTNAIVDEINVFWYKNRKLVEFALRNLVRPYQAYIFTGACTLDVENYEHYPFVSLGKFHIWDDLICDYINIVDKSFNSDFNKKMKKQIVETISDNLKILDEAEEIIYILPIRFLSNDIKQLIYDAGKQVFLSMFDKRYSFEEYMDKFSTIDDIRASLRSGIEQYIIFTEDEDISIAFETRFAKYKETTTLPVSKDACDAEIFLVAILGYLSQAFDILFTCIEYQLNPYIDFDVAFEYMLIISSNICCKIKIPNGGCGHFLGP